MSKFSYDQYQNVVAKAQGGSTNGGNNASSVKVGFFKLKDDGSEALVRINVGSLDDLQFATVHQLGAAQKWMKISCLNEVGSYSDNCPLCKRVADGDTTIGKAAKKVYVQMLVSYRDPATGGFSQPAVPVIWERPAGFSREIATLLRDYGNLREHVLKITRNGAAGSKQTTYSISYIPMYDKPETVTTDFSAFNNFNIAKHSYWEKTAEEIETFLATGSFPEVEKKSDNMTTLESGIKVGGAPVFTSAEEEAIADAALNPFGQPKPAPAPKYDDAPAPAASGPTPAPVVEASKAEEKPAEKTRSFNGFAF